MTKRTTILQRQNARNKQCDYITSNKYIHYYDKYKDSNKFHGLIYAYDFEPVSPNSMCNVANRIATDEKFNQMCEKLTLRRYEHKKG